MAKNSIIDILTLFNKIAIYFYNLEDVIAVGFRANSERVGTYLPSIPVFKNIFNCLRIISWMNKYAIITMPINSGIPMKGFNKASLRESTETLLNSWFINSVRAREIPSIIFEDCIEKRS